MSALPPGPQVSVVVACTRPERIEGIARALATDVDVSCELLVAGSVDGLDPAGWPVPTTLVPCDERHPNVRRRLALEQATGAVVAFVDDDAVPQQGWLRAAADLPAESNEIWTGPEVPVGTSAAALLAHAVGISPLAEGTRAHVAQGDHPLQWFEVPFCNLVVSRRFLDELPPLPVDVAWDVDDFVVCRGAAARGATFRNRPGLVVAHDRYPDRLVHWLRRKGAERRRTGEKLVRYPELYLELPGAVVAAAAPWAGLALLGLLGRRRRAALRLGALLYLGAAAGEALRTGRRGAEVASFAAGLAGLHVVSVVAMQRGLLEGAVARVTGRPDPHLLAPVASFAAATEPEGTPWVAPC